MAGTADKRLIITAGEVNNHPKPNRVYYRSRPSRPPSPIRLGSAVIRAG